MRWGWGMRSHERGGGLPLHKYLSNLLLKYILAFKLKNQGKCTSKFKVH